MKDKLTFEQECSLIANGEDLPKEKQNKVFDILSKMEFFQGQRAGRELWNDKPKEVQDQDLADFVKDINYIRSYLQDSVVLSREEICELKYQAEEDFSKAYDLGSKETAEKILREINNYLKLYSHIHNYAQEARKSTEQYADGEPVEMESVWDVITLNKNGYVNYETMNTLQDNIENIAKSRLLWEIEKDFRLFAEKYGVEIEE